MIKRNFGLLLMAAFSIAHHQWSFASTPHVIYGLEKATAYTPSAQQNLFFIQAGSFTEPSRATHYQHLLQAQTKYKVKLTQKGRLYHVLVGPFYSKREINRTAKVLLQSSAKKLTQPKANGAMHIAPIKVTPQTVEMPTRSQLEILPSTLPTLPSILPLRPVKPISSAQPIQSSKQTTSLDMNPASHWFVGVGGGGQSAHNTASMTVGNSSGFPAPYNRDLYTVNASNGFVFALTGGYRWERETQWLPSYSVGLLWQSLYGVNPHGTVMQYSDPEFSNYNYTWHFNANQLLASGKLNIIQYSIFSPFINLGLGTSLNSSSDYQETALANVTPRDNPAFASKTSADFSYQIGAGFDLHIAPSVIVSVGYNYQNLGSLASGYGVGSWSNESLQLDATSSNEIIVMVNYLFG